MATLDKRCDLTEVYAPHLLRRPRRIGSVTEEWESRHHYRASICLAGCNNASRGLMRLLMQKYEWEEVCSFCSNEVIFFGAVFCQVDNVGTDVGECDLLWTDQRAAIPYYRHFRSYKVAQRSCR